MTPLLQTPQWLPVLLAPLADGKTKKLPCDWRTGSPCNAHEPQYWTSYDQARACAQAWGPSYTVGFVLTRNDDFFCLDIDHARKPDGNWSDLAQALCAQLPGCLIEMSQSGQGLHVWGRYPNPPEHAKKRVDLGIELYTEARFIAIGTPLAGTIAPRCDALPAFMAAYFPQKTLAANLPADGPRADWRGPTDDDELLRRALNSKSTAAVFGGRASFADLFDYNVDVLARCYPDPEKDDGIDRSSADAALAQHLAFWTGCDQARMVRLMERSALKRDKWEREDYLPRTVAQAAGLQRDVLQDKAPAAGSTTSAGDQAAQLVYRNSIRSESPLESARGVLEREFSHPDGDRLRYWQGTFYQWGDSAYRSLTIDDVTAMLYRVLERHAEFTFKPTRDNVGKLQHALTAAANVPSRTSPPCWLRSDAGPPPAEIIACKNGLLHVPSGLLVPPTPAFFSMNAVPYKFDPAAPSPVAWLRFLSTVWPDDRESIETLQEVFGYLLTPDTRQQKAFLLIGPKRSGKGTIGRVLAGMLGSENVANPGISSLGGEFGLQPLLGKNAAIMSDVRLGSRADPKAVTENLLRITGEDSVSVNRKFLAPISLQLPVRFVMMSNEIPRLADASGAMASRFIILKMTHSFFEREDHGLTGRLLAELPGVLNWSIEGWRRLNERGHFVQPRTGRDDIEAMADLGSPISAFVRDVCDVAPAAEATVDRLHQLWSAWCRDQGVERPTTKQVFGADLKAAVPGVHIAQRRLEGNERARFYQGIGVRPGTRWHAFPTIAPN